MQAIVEQANQSLEATQEAHDDVPNVSLKLLRDKIEYSDVKADFSGNQTILNKEIMHDMELKDKELKEEQESTDKLEERAELEKNLVIFVKNPQNVKEHKKGDDTFIRTNGCYHCPECDYETKWSRNHLKIYINAIHRKLKPWKCSDCTKGIKTYHFKYYL